MSTGEPTSALLHVPSLTRKPPTNLFLLRCPSNPSCHYCMYPSLPLICSFAMVVYAMARNQQPFRGLDVHVILPPHRPFHPLFTHPLTHPLTLPSHIFSHISSHTHLALSHILSHSPCPLTHPLTLTLPCPTPSSPPPILHTHSDISSHAHFHTLSYPLPPSQTPHTTTPIISFPSPPLSRSPIISIKSHRVQVVERGERPTLESSWPKSFCTLLEEVH